MRRRTRRSSPPTAKISDREARVRQLLSATSAEFVRRELLAAEFDVEVVLMVGGGSSDAWMDVLDGHPTLFVALETLDDQAAADDLLIVHEFVHLAHLAQFPNPGPLTALRDRPVIRVWAEGLAVATTRVLRPGLEESAYFSVEDPGWIGACAEHRAVLARAMKENLTRVDADLAYRVCGVTDREPWPSRAGYWLGDAIVAEQLARAVPLKGLFTWDQEQIGEAFRTSPLLRGS